MLWRHLKQNPEQELSDPLWGTSSGIWSMPLLGFCSMSFISGREDVGFSCVSTLDPTASRPLSVLMCVDGSLESAHLSAPSLPSLTLSVMAWHSSRTVVHQECLN